MPKQNFEIRNFNFGIVAHPTDARDIPDNAATDALNLDSLGKGELRGIPDDLLLKGNGFSSINFSSLVYKQGNTSSGTSGEPES